MIHQIHCIALYSVSLYKRDTRCIGFPLCEDVRANVYRNPRNLISYGTLSVGSRMLSVRQRVIEGHKNMFRSIVRIATAEL